MTTIREFSSPYAPDAATISARPSGRGWQFAGLAAGVAGTVSIGTSMNIDAVYAADDTRDVAAQLHSQIPALLTFHTATVIAAVSIIVFAAGLSQRLRSRGLTESILPQVSAYGLILVATALLLGSGLNTEFIFGALASADPGAGQLVPEAGVFYAHWIATIPWLWLGAGVSAITLAIAALKHGAAPRWIGWASALLGGVTLLFGLSPLQYMAGFTGPVWLVLAALGLWLSSGTRTSARPS